MLRIATKAAAEAVGKVVRYVTCCGLSLAGLGRDTGGAVAAYRRPSLYWVFFFVLFLVIYLFFPFLPRGTESPNRVNMFRWKSFFIFLP